MLRRTLIQNTKVSIRGGLLDRTAYGPSSGNPLRSSKANWQAAHVEPPAVRTAARPADTCQRSSGLDQWSTAGTCRMHKSGTVHTSRRVQQTPSTSGAGVGRADGNPRPVFHGHGGSLLVLRASWFA